MFNIFRKRNEKKRQSQLSADELENLAQLYGQLWPNDPAWITDSLSQAAALRRREELRVKELLRQGIIKKIRGNQQ